MLSKVQIYECVFVASGSLNDAAVANLIKNFSTTFAENNIKVIRQENWGALSLAYKISGNNKANYFMFVLQSDPCSLSKFEKKLKYNDLIIRFLIQRKKNSELFLSNSGISLNMPKSAHKEKTDSSQRSVNQLN